MMFGTDTGRAQTNLVLSVKEKALEIVRTRGPLLPVQITKELGVNVLFAGALLSELVDNQTLKISNTKIGGSPVYYVAGQEPKLQSLRDKLNDKQQTAFDMLKQNLILQDTKLEPVIRQSYREMKDFAVPLRVTAGELQDIFWKWYLITDEEAEPIIKKSLASLEKKEEKKVQPQQEMQKQLSEIEDELKKLEERKVRAINDINQREKEVKELESRKIIEQKVREEMAKQPSVEKQKVQKARKPRTVVEKAPEIQLPVEEKKNEIDTEDAFMMTVLTYFKKNKIDVSEIKQIRQNSDFEGVVKIPTAVGAVSYFCKAKNKLKINDADLSLLFVQAQMKKMPILLMTTGDLTKKAQELLTTEFKNITIKKIEEEQ